MCQDDVENIIKELNLLEREFTQAFPDAKVRKDQEIIVEKYMVEVLEVLDRSDPHRWSLVDAPTRANASTRIQKSLTSASLAIATTLYNESVNYTSRISEKQQLSGHSIPVAGDCLTRVMGISEQELLLVQSMTSLCRANRSLPVTVYVSRALKGDHVPG
nr:uncharacterized protein LOC128701882 [Cherax quadricarinatus]